MKKKLLIIGSTGFIGKSIIDFLEKNKKYDKFFSHIILLSKSKKNYISKKLKSKFKISTIYKDLSKLDKLPFADFIIYSSLSKNSSKDLAMMNNYVKLAKKFHRGSKIIYLSSGAVNGKQPFNIKSVKEEDNFKITNFDDTYKKNYSMTKKKNENKLKTLLKFNNKIIIARCFTFVGDYLPLKDKFLIGHIIRQVIEDKKIIVELNHRVIRSFMHALELAKIIFILLTKEKNNFEVYNIGSDDSYDICSLIRKISSKYKIKFFIKKSSKNLKTNIYIPNISKFRNKYSYFNKMSTLKAVFKTIDNLNKTIYKT